MNSDVTPQAIERRVTAFLLPVVLYLLLRPENYGIAPNNLDPLFYSAYGINFGDAIAASRDGHYFVSRWSAYLPLTIGNTIAGPIYGRLLLRWAMASMMILAVWRLRPDQSRLERIMAAVVLITMPMFLRAFFTDYVEYMIVTLLVALIVLALREEQTPLTLVAAGAITGLILVANPFAGSATALPLAALVLGGARTFARRARYSTIILGTAGLVILLGLAWFRLRFGFANVYQPTLNFLRDPPGPDALKSSTLEWMGRFVWIYATPVVLAVAAISHRLGSIVFDRTDRVALALCGGQYTIQCLDQFVRDGNGLEISYYWSFAYPSFAIALVLLINRLAQNADRLVVVGTATGWLGLLIVGVPDALRLPPSWGFAIIAATVVGLATTISRLRSDLALPILLGFVLWTQIGAPIHDVDALTDPSISPHYDQMFGSDGDFSEAIYREGIWFADQMDTIPNDAHASFLPLSGPAGLMPALYLAHVSGHLLGTGPNGGLDDYGIRRLQSGQDPVLVIVGAPNEVETAWLATIDEIGEHPILLDETRDEGLGFRILALSLPSMYDPTFTWPADTLPRQIGVTMPSSPVVQSPASGSPGYLTFGPYVELSRGEYLVSVTYSSSAAEGIEVGAADVFSATRGVASTVPLTATGGASTSIQLAFEVTDPTSLWEFRTLWSGEGDLAIESITLERTSTD